MKKTITLIILLIPAVVFAQTEPGTMTLSLQEARDLGVKNRNDMQADKFNIDLADNHLNKTKKEYLPDLSGTGNIRYNPQIQSTLIPGGFLGPLPSSIAFGAKTNSVFGLDLNQSIFKPGIAADIKIAKNDLAIAREKNKQQENDIREQITQSYLNVLLKKLQVDILKKDEQRYKEYAALAEGQFKQGTLIENDYRKATLDYENAKVVTATTIQTYQLALSNMKYQVNLPAQTEIILSDSLNSSGVASMNLSGIQDATNRTEIKQLLLSQANNKLQLKKSMQSTLPSVAFYANYSQQYQYNNFSYTDGRWWSPFSYFGISIKIPISANFKNRNDIRENRWKSLQTDLLLKQKTADVDYEIQRASTELNNAMENMQATKRNYDLSQVVYNTQKQQFDLGTLLYSNLLETDRSLNTTEQNYIKAVYDYLVAKVNYQHATGVFYN